MLATISERRGSVRQTLTLVLAWIHACIGVHFWLRFRPWYAGARPWLFAIALLLPTLAEARATWT